MFGIFKSKNRNSKSERSNTGYKGITLRTNLKKQYQAHVAIVRRDDRGFKTKNQTIWSKRFTNIEEAIKAREEFIDGLY